MALTQLEDKELSAPITPKRKPSNRRKRANDINKKQQQQVKQQTRRPRSNSESSDNMSVDTCSTAPLSDDSSTGSTGSPVRTNTRRRTRTRKNKGKKQQQKKQQQPKEEEQLSPEEKANYIALDCEMVGVGQYGSESALARVTLVDWDGNIVLDEYIAPECEITDYRTFVSGISPQDLQNCHLTLPQVRKIVSSHLQDKILVGHALKNDLHALGIRHPWQHTRDTAKYEPFMKVRFDDGVLWPRKLRDLVTEKLDREIQLPGVAHSPYEDALAAMDLYKKVRTKWEKVMDYKIKKTAAIQKQQQMPQAA